MSIPPAQLPSTTHAPPDEGKIGLSDIWAARQTLLPFVRRTPILSHPLLDEALGASIYLKSEHLQLTGAFKFRGMFNRMSGLSPDERSRGVLTVSSGNAAQGVALAARLLGLSATVLMPMNAPEVKSQAVKALGAKIVKLDGDSEVLFRAASDMVMEQGLLFVHPFDHPLVVAGQGTIGLELLEDIPSLDCVLMPTSGGGMLSGVATAVKTLSPHTSVIGVQPEGAATIRQALDVGHPVTLDEVNTLADALTARRCGDLTLSIISRLADDVVLVSDDDLFESVRVLWTTARMAVELGGAAGFAALLRYPALRKGNIAVVISGGNIEPDQLAFIAGGGTATDWRKSVTATLRA